MELSDEQSNVPGMCKKTCSG